MKNKPVNIDENASVTPSNYWTDGGGWLTPYGQEQTHKLERQRAATIRDAADGLRRHRLEQIMARFELESDEFRTAEQKAADILATNPNA